MKNRVDHYSRAQDVDISHRGSAIQRQSVTVGCDCREIAVESVGSRVPAKVSVW